MGKHKKRERERDVRERERERRSYICSQTARGCVRAGFNTPGVILGITLTTMFILSKISHLHRSKLFLANPVWGIFDHSVCVECICHLWFVETHFDKGKGGPVFLRDGV